MRERELRRNGGFLSRCVNRVNWRTFSDERKDRGKRWSCPELLKWSLVGLLCGAKGLAEVEEISTRLSAPMRRLCKLGFKRLPDTTLRSFMCGLAWPMARQLLHQVVRIAQRGGQLKHRDCYPFAIISMDGKYQVLRTTEGEFVQHTEPSHPGGKPYGKLRLIHSVLQSAVGRPCIDASPIPGHTNEVGHFATAFLELKEKFGHLFEMVCYDSGGVSAQNAALVHKMGKHYLFQIKNETHHQVQAAIDYLAKAKDLVITEDPKEGTTHKLRLFAVNDGPLGQFCGKSIDQIFDSAKLLLRVEVVRKNKKTGFYQSEFRYYLCSKERRAMPPQTWLQLIIERWSVETAHQILDVGLQEDDRPGITMDGNGALVFALIRRAAYTLLTLFKNVTVQNLDDQMRSYAYFMRWLRDTAVAMTDQAAKNITIRKPIAQTY